MLAIARALMARPKLMLMDEPSMGLSPILVKEIYNIIKGINSEGTTILLVEQNARMALSVAPLRLCPGERPHRAVRRGPKAHEERGRHGVLPRHQGIFQGQVLQEEEEVVLRTQRREESGGLLNQGQTEWQRALTDHFTLGSWPRISA
jgi:ABC-type nitrate/sulfonate/bicarbonate transport system ATPase subunit